MHRYRPLAAALASVLVCSPALAVDTTLTQAGYTGLGITPNAHLLGWGRFEASYDKQIPGLVRDPQGHNFVAGFGLLPNLEVSGRLATNNIHGNCFAQECGTRDESASLKAGIGLDSASRFRAAAGVADYGGQATHFRTYYGVLTYNEGNFEISGGLARRRLGVDGARAPLHGPFASAAWQPLPWVRGQIEYADGNGWAGVRLFAPKEWLPEGWSAYVGANQRLNDNNLTRKSWWSLGVSIPLYKVPSLPAHAAGAPAPLPALQGNQQPLPAYEVRTVAVPPAQLPTTQNPIAPNPTVAAVLPASTQQLQVLAAALQDKGLEDISVGRMPDGSIAVQANNASYNWNALDALGAALGAVSRTLGEGKTAYRLVLTQRQTPLVAVTGQTDCLRQWIAGNNDSCVAGQLSTPGIAPLEPLVAGADWVVKDLQPSSKTLRLALSPVLRTHNGTELGAFDYSAGVNLGLTLPLWAGASVEWRRDVALSHSRNFSDVGVFNTERVRNETERLAFTQTVRLPLEKWLAAGDDLKARRWGLGGVTAQASVGRFGHHFDGALGALRWEPGEGYHRLGAQLGYLRNQEFQVGSGEPRTARPALASYRYNLTATRTYLEATGGQFMNNDRGLQLGIRQWFSDVSVSAYYKRTTISGGPTRRLLGLEVSVPIGPRRDMNPRGVQLTGTPRFSHAVQTTVATGTGSNPIVTNRALQPPAPTLDAMYNSDRASLLYFEDNIRRIREAAL